ncbi:MAG: BtaA family protein [Myxococcales bacterium]|nr:BtaA family protein [Myxococcales bacterium]
MTSWFFRFVHRHFIVFNSCFEDPRLDRRALRLGQGDRLAVITSAGCNALEYLLDGPDHVHAVDVNPLQNHLLELKIAAIRGLPHATFFQLFGEGRLDGFGEVYRAQLRAELSAPAQAFWDRRTHYFEGTRAFPTFYHRGATGLAAKLARAYLRSRGIPPQRIRALFDVDDPQERRQQFEALQPRLWTRLGRWAVEREPVLALLGYHGTQRRQILETHGGVAGYLAELLARIFTKLPLHDNYFWWVYLAGSYTRDRCPAYLQERHFSLLQQRVDRISVHTGTLTSFLTQRPQPISAFVLLDHMDWLSTHDRAALAEEWSHITARSTDGARVLWRSIARSTDYVDDLQISRGGERMRLGDLLRYDEALAEALHPLDRTGIYQCLRIATLPG